MAKSTHASKADTSKSVSTQEQESISQPGKPIIKDPALTELFKEEIMDLYWAENQLVKCLPLMQQAATSEVLANAIATHLEQTKTHVKRLDQVFELLGEKPRAKKCDAMEGLTKEGEAVIEDTEEGTATRDVGIIIASQKVEHYEIAAYGSLSQLAKTLGMTDIADILTTTLQEEKDTDELLTQIAENDINYAASAEQ